MIRLNEHVDRQPSEYCYVKRVIGERSMPDQCRRGEARHVAKSFGRRYCLLMVAVEQGPRAHLSASPISDAVLPVTGHQSPRLRSLVGSLLHTLHTQQLRLHELNVTRRRTAGR